MKLLTIASALTLFTSSLFAQNTCNTPATWEGVGFDIKPSIEDSIVICKYKNEIDKLLCLSRTTNKSRLYSYVFPEEVLNTKYSKALTTKYNGQNTLPVFKFILWNNESKVTSPRVAKEDFEYKVKTNKYTSDSIYNSNNESYPELMSVQGFDSIVDSKVKYSRYFEDPYEEVPSSVVYTTADWSIYKECFSGKDINTIASYKVKEQYDEYFAFWESRTSIKVRFHVDTNGLVKYISQDNLSEVSPDSDCFKKQLSAYVGLLINKYDFKPAIKNGVPVNSYFDITVTSEGIPYNDSDSHKTERKGPSKKY